MFGIDTCINTRFLNRVVVYYWDQLGASEQEARLNVDRLLIFQVPIDMNFVAFRIILDAYDIKVAVAIEVAQLARVISFAFWYLIFF